MGNAMGFEDVPSRYDGVRLEEEVLALWREHDVFNEAQRRSEGRPLYCWNEGPPTANGRPGIHHVLARTFKDIFPRFKHMQGYHCPRKAGWDTHGLPVEHEIEKELGIFDKAEIERQVGVAEFTRRCRESVMRYIGDWERMTERMGFWVNMGEAYHTLDNTFIESVWWLLRRIWDKGLIYQGYKVVPYDPRIGATLSSHEVALGYKEVEDPSVYVRFPVEGEECTSFLVWTTTPWTLPSNLALAVHPEVDYVFVRTDSARAASSPDSARVASSPDSARAASPPGSARAASSLGGETLVLAEALLGAVLGDAAYTIEKRVKGSDLEGMRYSRLFDYLPADGPICRVWAADFVTIEDGTGIVHCAPAYGEDDIRLCRAKGLPVVHGVGLDGCFVPEVEPVAGKFFKDADPILIAQLEERGLMYRSGRYKHNYPHGWRTGDPLIYYAKHAWYIETSRIRDRMVELNRTINWVPETIREGRFGNWLANNVDWALSRERFWGTPLPVWTDGEGDFKCIGSIAELEALCGRSLEGVDLHRPAVDEITFVHPDNGRMYRRVPEVIDCWFDSGAMSYAQFHYPFENRDLFESRFPADYICEAIDQTRGWFYSLHAIAALVSDSVAYRNCICLAHIVDKDGKKMSKSQGNIVDPYDVFDHVGADPLRWYLACRIAPEVQKRISVGFVRDVASGFINTWWNTYAFFVLYAKRDGFDVRCDVPLAERNEMDRWVLALLHRTVVDVTDALEAYDVLAAGRAIESFVDQLSNWYVRRNRRRFWRTSASQDAFTHTEQARLRARSTAHWNQPAGGDGNPPDSSKAPVDRNKQAAYLSLYECLHTVNRLMAPIMPFISEAVHQNLVRGVDDAACTSVHMSEWPAPDPEARNDALIAELDVVQRVVGLGRAARNRSRVRVRQPLSRLLVRAPGEASAAAVARHEDQILDELNVKAVERLAPDAELVDYRIKPNLPRIGKRYGRRVPAVRDGLGASDGSAIAAAVAAGRTFDVVVDGEILTFEPEDVLVESTSAEGYACAEEGGYLVGLDTTLTETLEREGLARELVRTVQEARKQAGLDVSDRISLRIEGSPGVAATLDAHREYVMEETLAIAWRAADWAPPYSVEHTFGAQRWTIGLARVEGQ